VVDVGDLAVLWVTDTEEVADRDARPLADSREDGEDEPVGRGDRESEATGDCEESRDTERRDDAETVTQRENRALSVGETLVDASTDADAKELWLATTVTDDIGERETESSAVGEKDTLDVIEPLVVIVTADDIVGTKTDAVIDGVLVAILESVSAEDALDVSTIEDDPSIERDRSEDDDAAAVIELKPETLKTPDGELIAVPVCCAEFEFKCVIEAVPDNTGEAEAVTSCE
jgi:hypothetical protein